jgi:hypothetical protein
VVPLTVAVSSVAWAKTGMQLRIITSAIIAARILLLILFLPSNCIYTKAAQTA